MQQCVLVGHMVTDSPASRQMIGFPTCAHGRVVTGDEEWRLKPTACVRNDRRMKCSEALGVFDHRLVSILLCLPPPPLLGRDR